MDQRSPGVTAPDMTPRLLSVTHFGPYPPTYGGVSVHIRRLHLRLLRLGCKSTVITPPGFAAFPETGVSVAGRFRRRSHWLRYPGIPIPGEIVHCHDCWMRMSWVLCRLRLQGRALVITVHDQQDARRWNTVGFDRRLAGRLLARLPGVHWIAVSQNVRQQLLARGVQDRQIQVIPAFILPAREDSITDALPSALLAFLATHQPVLSIYGSKYDFVQGVDLYGFDMAIEALASLKSKHPSIGLVVSVPTNSHHVYQSELARRATELGCADRVLFLNEGVLDGCELWRRSNVHLRPTVTDGDSVAVREALALGVAVVASDAATRPSGCIQFPSRNMQTFVSAILEAITGPRTGSHNAETTSNAYFRAIVFQYKDAVLAKSSMSRDACIEQAT